MELNWENLDADILHRLYRAKEKELEAAILSGVSWNEASIKRKALAELSCALHNKLGGENNQSPNSPGRPGSEE